jgi:hypothetical protein
MIVDSFDVSISSCCDEYVVTNSYEDQAAHKKLFFQEHHETMIFECQDS